MNQYKIIQSTDRKYLGNVLTGNQLTKEMLQTKFKQGFLIILQKENLFRCVNEHMTLMIKKENK